MMMKQKLINYQREEHHEFVDQVLKPTSQPTELSQEYKEDKEHNIPIVSTFLKKSTISF